jgi:hypothetical protein
MERGREKGRDGGWGEKKRGRGGRRVRKGRELALSLLQNCRTPPK